MVSSNYNYQYIDWSHDAIPGEDFEHLGNLVTHLITPTITLGLSDYLNISYQQAIGIRSMDWMGSNDSNHHRDEDSLDSFLNVLVGVIEAFKSSSGFFHFVVSLVLLVSKIEAATLESKFSPISLPIYPPTNEPNIANGIIYLLFPISFAMRYPE